MVFLPLGYSRIKQRMPNVFLCEQIKQGMSNVFLCEQIKQRMSNVFLCEQIKQRMPNVFLCEQILHVCCVYTALLCMQKIVKYTQKYKIIRPLGRTSYRHVYRCGSCSTIA